MKTHYLKFHGKIVLEMYTDDYKAVRRVRRSIIYHNRHVSRKRRIRLRRQQQRNAQRMREALDEIVTVKGLFQEYLEKLHAAYPHYEPFQSPEAIESENTCCCGEPMRGGYHDNHTPVSMAAHARRTDDFDVEQGEHPESFDNLY